jgi:negative regulator of sigma F NrsF-like protein
LVAWAAAEQQGLRVEKEHELCGVLTASLKPVRQLPSKAKLTGRFLLAFAACAAGLMATLDKAGFHMMTAAQMTGMAVILAGGGVLFSVSLVGRMVPGSRSTLPFWMLLVTSGLAVSGGMALLFPWRASHVFVSEGWPCAVMELAIAVPAAAIFWSLARRGALFASAGLGAALTGLAVFLALTAVQFQCMYPQAPHVLVWHGGMAVLLIALGAAIGRAMELRLP